MTQFEGGRGLCAILVLSLLLVGCGVVALSVDLEASDDAEWRDPPNADYVIEITQDLTFKSNDPEYSLEILSQDFFVDDDVFGAVSDDSQDDMAQFVKSVRNLGTSGIHTVVDDATSDGWTDAVIPSWINADIANDHDLFGDYHDGIVITIMPALQQVSEDTHGDYWIYYSMTQDGPGMSNPVTKTFLFTFSVNVEWNGGVIVPDIYNQFVACIDWGNGYVQSLTPVTFAENVTSAAFDVPDSPEREGYTLKGISTAPSGAVISGDLVVSVGASNVTVEDNGDGGKVYTGMFYAIWEYDHLTIPTFWDGLIELLSDPIVLLLLFVGFLSVCLFIRNRNVRYYRWSRFSR